MKNCLAIAALLISLRAIAFGDLVLSEILANEPGSRVLLEWIELYNNSPLQIDMGDYLLVENDDTLTIPPGSLIDAESYAVICRRLVPSDGSDCYEYHWGDSSGVWGDSPLENYQAYELGLTLSNGSGSVYLLTSAGFGIDHYIWNRSSSDGRSVERDDVADEMSSWHECYATEGSTPGKTNSLKPNEESNYFLEITPQAASLSGIEPAITISYAAPTGTRISLFVYDDTALKRVTLADKSDNPLGRIIWNLKDDNDHLLQPGLYFILFQAEDKINAQKSIPVVISP
ncbi:MAG: lamin tail domain-containing protein [candidate division Zixibacteria bacterium]|nr:lamin tail domain-containing protein [candidate division Zixibacteria bacterium]